MAHRTNKPQSKRREFVEVQKRMTEQVVQSKKKYSRKKEKRKDYETD